MPTSYQINDQEGLYYLTFQVVWWVDIFTRQAIRDIFVDSLRYCQQNKGLYLCAWVLYIAQESRAKNQDARQMKLAHYV